MLFFYQNGKQVSTPPSPPPYYPSLQTYIYGTPISEMTDTHIVWYLEQWKLNIAWHHCLTDINVLIIIQMG